MKLQRDFLNFEIYPELKSADNLNFIYENNSKNTLIVLKDANSKNLEFLSKILSAIKYDITKDILLLEIADNQRVNFSELKKSIPTNIENIVLFGIKPEQLHLQFRLPNYYKLPINKLHFLAVEDLEMISKNNTKKKELWAALQAMFL
jgi:hypothetical protein